MWDAQIIYEHLCVHTVKQIISTVYKAQIIRGWNKCNNLSLGSKDKLWDVYTNKYDN